VRASVEGTHQRGVGEGTGGHQRLEVGLNTACLFSGSAPPGLVLQPSLPHHATVSRGPHPPAAQTKAPRTQSMWLGCMFVGAEQCVCVVVAATSGVEALIGKDGPTRSLPT
jgi:hypothetical protein